MSWWAIRCSRAKRQARGVRSSLPPGPFYLTTAVAERKTVAVRTGFACTRPHHVIQQLLSYVGGHRHDLWRSRRKPAPTLILKPPEKWCRNRRFPASMPAVVTPQRHYTVCGYYDRTVPKRVSAGRSDRAGVHPCAERLRQIGGPERMCWSLAPGVSGSGSVWLGRWDQHQHGRIVLSHSSSGGSTAPTTTSARSTCTATWPSSTSVTPPARCTTAFGCRP
jgi:hypothetical protein